MDPTTHFSLKFRGFLLALLSALIIVLALGCDPEAATGGTDDDTTTGVPDSLDYTGQFGAVYLGAGQGTQFTLYAPRASAVEVRGVFNGWGGDRTDAMSEVQAGVWQVTIADTAPGDQYKYFSNDFGVYNSENTDFIAGWAGDPYAMATSTGDENSIIVDHSVAPFAHSWTSAEDWGRPAREDLVIYELHPADFTRGDDTGGSGTTASYTIDPNNEGNLLGIADKVDYLVELGVNAIELMPVQEWRGEGYSWGYNTDEYFSIENGYAASEQEGTGRAIADLKAVVDVMHQNGIAVILDVVYNHTTGSAEAWKVDAGLYYSRDGAYDGTPFGPGIDITRPASARLVKDNLRYLMDEFRIDGFRFDFTQYLHMDTLIDIVDELASEGYEDHYYIFEEFDGGHNQAIKDYNAGRSQPLIASWGVGYKNSAWAWMGLDGSGFNNLGTLTYHANDWGWTPTSALMYYASHDEGTLQGRFGADPADARLAATHLLTLIGTPMLWMGEEINHVHYGNYTPAGYPHSNVSPEANLVEWDELLVSGTGVATAVTENQETWAYYSELIKMRTGNSNLPVMRENPDTNGSSFDDGFQWNTDWAGDGYIGYVYADSGDEAFAVFVNYGSSTKTYDAAFPQSGTWVLVADSLAGVADSGLSSVSGSSSAGDIAVSGGSASVEVAANQALIYVSPAVQ